MSQICYLRASFDLMAIMGKHFEGGGAQTVSDLQFSNFVAPSLPLINDQSLNGHHLLTLHRTYIRILMLKHLKTWLGFFY